MVIARPATARDETLGRMYEALQAEGIHITYSGMDCASYQKDVVNVVEANSKYFYTCLLASRSGQIVARICMKK